MMTEVQQSDYYEEMFDEITKKFYYGDEDEQGPNTQADQLEIANIKSEPETEVGFEVTVKTEPTDINFLDPTEYTEEKFTLDEEQTWICSAETLPWTNSKIASYNTSQKLFRCNECECIGFLSRIAEHWLGSHANLRVFQCSQCAYASAWARCVKMHLARQHNLFPEQNSEDEFQKLLNINPILEEVTKYLESLKLKLEPSEGVEETKLESESATSPPNTDHRVPSEMFATLSSIKRYNCRHCSYSTDRKDLFTRHENIHRDEKPFQCNVCQRQFNRADHIKKHFVRLHRDHEYIISNVKRPKKKETAPDEKDPMQDFFQAPEPDPLDISFFGTHTLLMPAVKQPRPRKIAIEKNVQCTYCTWTGADNWCLKRHLNTHLKPYVCNLCDYKAARPERLSNHMYKVHNKRICTKCSYLADDMMELAKHQHEKHKGMRFRRKIPMALIGMETEIPVTEAL